MARKSQTKHPRLVLRVSPFGALWAARQVDPAEDDFPTHGVSAGHALDCLLAKVPAFEPEDLPVILDLRERPVFVVDLETIGPVAPVYAPTLFRATSNRAECRDLVGEAGDPYSAVINLLKAAGLADAATGIRFNVGDRPTKAYIT